MAEAKTEKWYDITDLLNKECSFKIVIGKRGDRKCIQANPDCDILTEYVRRELKENDRNKK